MERKAQERWAWALAAAVLTGACGAKTALRVPGVDAAVPVVADACVPGEFQLARRSAEIVLVIDRSGSMNDRLGGATRLTRWEAMRQGLRATLPPFESTLDMGLLFFPSNNRSRESCPVAAEPEVTPERSNAGRILLVLDSTEPGGGTPTQRAIRSAAGYLIRRASPLRGRAMVLATDGQPSCDTGDTVDGTVSAIEGAHAAGVPTFVIGIDDATAMFFSDALNRMAVAGGRPNPLGGQRRYYSVRSQADLNEAFTSIQRTLAVCTLISPSRPDDPDAVVLSLGDEPIPRDTSRRDGWDWTDLRSGELTLFGSACDRAERSGAPLRVRIVCSPDGG